MAVVDDIRTFETQLENLRQQFERYFLGIDARPPMEERARLQSVFNRLTNQMVARTAEKFMMENIRQKFSSYKAYWDRTLREIEDGTYRRHILKAKLREKLAREFEEANPTATSSASPLGDDGAYDLSAGLDSGMDAQPESKRYEDVYRAYKQAGKNVNYDKLEATLRKQEEALKKKFGAAKVDFKLVEENGQHKLKAIPRKD